MFRAIREQIDTIFREDRAAKSVIEIFLCYPGFHAFPGGIQSALISQESCDFINRLGARRIISSSGRRGPALGRGRPTGFSPNKKFIESRA
jgi:serine acetyltransferase